MHFCSPCRTSIVHRHSLDSAEVGVYTRTVDPTNENVLFHDVFAARPRTYLLQTGSFDVSIHPQHLSVLPTVVFHPCCRHDIQTTAAVFYLTSSGPSARSSLYSQQADVSGFWCHRLERPASPRRICAVTGGFQTTTQDLSVVPFLPRHYHVTIHHYCLDTCGPCNN